MRTLKFVMLICFYFFSKSAFSSEPWLVVSKNKNQYIVDQFKLSADGWQDKIKTKSFSDLKQTKFYLNSLSTKKIIFAEQELKQSLNLQSQDLLEIQNGRELKDFENASAGTELWTAQYKWDQSWEQKFSDWIVSSVDTHFFETYRLRTDCADVLYSLRWIFARIHKLEMASRLSGSGDYLTNRSVRSSWQKLPTHTDWHQDKRFLAALDYLLENTYTHSLMLDAYPVAIRRDVITPGTFHLDLHQDSGHTQVVYRTSLQPEVLLPFIVFQSTTPRNIRPMMVSGFWYQNQPLRYQGGLLKMRWPLFYGKSVRLVDENQMPDFSTEQYSTQFLRNKNFAFNQEVYLRLEPNLDWGKVIEEAYLSLQKMFSDRLQIVEDGYRICKQTSCAPGSAEYEDWSTPNRDARILDLVSQIDLIMQTASFKIPSTIENILQQPFLRFNQVDYNLKHLLATWNAKAFSSDPRDEIQDRWNIEGNNTSKWFLNQLTQLIASRERSLRASKSSIEIDKKIWQAQSWLNSFCKTAPVNECQRLKTANQTNQMTINGQTLNLQNWLLKINWFQSDPKMSPETQWGDQNKNYDWLAITANADSKYSDKGFVLERPEKLQNYWNLKKWAQGGGTTILSFTAEISELIQDTEDSQQLFVVFSNQEKLGFFNVETQKIEYSNLKFIPTLGAKAGTGFVFWNPQTQQVVIGQVRHGQVQILAEQHYTWTSLYPKISGQFESFFISDQSQTTLWQMTQAYTGADLVQIKSPVTITAESKNWLSLGASGLLNKTTKTLFLGWTDRQVIRCQVKNDFCLTIEVDANAQKVVSGFIQANGDFHIEKTIEKFAGLRDNLIYTSDKQFYQIREDRTELISLLSDEFFVNSAMNDFILTQTMNGSRLRKNKQILFEKPGSYLFSFAASDLHRGYFLEYDRQIERTHIRKIEQPWEPLMSFDSATHIDVSSGVLSPTGIWLR